MGNPSDLHPFYLNLNIQVPVEAIERFVDGRTYKYVLGIDYQQIINAPIERGAGTMIGDNDTMRINVEGNDPSDGTKFNESIPIDNDGSDGNSIESSRQTVALSEPSNPMEITD